MSRLERTSERYRTHHREDRPPDFVYARPERAPLFARYVGGPGRRVLDIGCRTGALTRSYLAGNEVVGIDVDREALEQAAKLGIETHWADAEEPLEFPDESFDVVVLGEVVEHVRDPWALVEEATRVLRPGGTLLGSTPNGYRLKNRVRFLLGRSPEANPTHLHLFSSSDVLGLLDGLEDPKLHFIAGRLVRLHPRLFANVIAFSARKPR